MHQLDWSGMGNFGNIKSHVSDFYPGNETHLFNRFGLEVIYEITSSGDVRLWSDAGSHGFVLTEPHPAPGAPVKSSMLHVDECFVGRTNT